MFSLRLHDAIQAVGTPLCVGLDPMLASLPPSLGAPRDRHEAAAAASRFCAGVVEACAGRVAVVKPQSAYFEAFGAPGIEALEGVIRHARSLGLLVVLDAKRGDIGSTAEAYANAAFDVAGADALTVSPYLGPESLAPFVRRGPDRGVFVLLRTSNPGAASFQGGPDQGMASAVASWVTTAGPSVGVVVGATLAKEERRAWRRRLPGVWILAPGLGAQGATAADVWDLADSDGSYVLPVAARSVLYPPSGLDGADWQAAVADRLEAHVSALSATRPPPLSPGAARR